MVSQYFVTWLEVIAITFLSGVLIAEAVPPFVLYFVVSFFGLIFIVHRAKNWDYVKKGGM